jgi:hypothetical protein
VDDPSRSHCAATPCGWLAGRRLSLGGDFAEERGGVLRGEGGSGEGVPGGVHGADIGAAAGEGELAGGSVVAAGVVGLAGQGKESEGRAEHGCAGVVGDDLDGQGGVGGEVGEVAELGGGDGCGGGEVVQGCLVGEVVQGGLVDEDVQAAVIS